MGYRVLLATSVVATSLVLSACGGGAESANSPVTPGAREIAVTAQGLSFTPEEVRVAPGEDVTIVLESKDGRHDFVVDELGTYVDVLPGDVARGGLRAAEPGRYEFYCSIPGHRAGGMEGVLIVE